MVCLLNIRDVEDVLRIGGLCRIRENMLRLQEKERMEKEKLQQIIDDADDYKDKHRAKRDSNREAQMKANRDKELVYRSFLMLIASHVYPLRARCWQTLEQTEMFQDV